MNYLKIVNFTLKFVMKSLAHKIPLQLESI
jgi:hypothetical protein